MNFNIDFINGEYHLRNLKQLNGTWGYYTLLTFKSKQKAVKTLCKMTENLK